MILALEHIHTLSIVYRDLKPENILFTLDGHIKVIDFGMCKPDMRRGRKTYTICGTTEFMAPEIILESGYTFPVDLWALGVIAYDMVVGRTPFCSRSDDHTKDLICYAELSFPGFVEKECFKDLLFKLMRKESAKRYTITEVKEDPFFATINWDDVLNKRITPPMTFKEYNKHKNIDPPWDSQYVRFHIKGYTDDVFKDFEFVIEDEESD